MPYCLICKEIVGERFPLEANDTEAEAEIKGHLCKYCFDKFAASSRNEGSFQLSKFMGWARSKRDRMRFI